MALLTKDEILAVDDKRTAIVEVPEWGGEVIVSVMSGEARDRFESSCLAKSGGTNLHNIRAKLVAATVIDDSGDLMFNERDIAKLGKKSGAALARVVEAAENLNKMSDNDVEELAKN